MTRDIIDLVQKIAKLSATVLILGESGTGKELMARLIHREAGDAEAPFIVVNLAAIPRELPRARCSATSAGVHRRPSQQLGNSSSHRTARCSSTRSAICGSICRRSSCAPSRGEIERSAATSRSKQSSV
jgi:hypothetical protein